MKIEADIVALAQKHHLEKVVLFGSRAKGTSWEKSDIDIAVYGFQSAKVRARFEEDIKSLPTLLLIDVVDMNSSLVGINLQSEIEKDGITLWENPNQIVVRN